MPIRLFSSRAAAGDPANATLAAISRAQALIEFSLDGTILTANANFLAVVGYELGEIVGRHHRMFAEPAYAQSPQYLQFWERLRRGEFDAGEYRRLGKDGREIWIQASYNPVLDAAGKPVKIVKIAVDITARKRAAADAEGQLAAIGKSQAVIEFTLGGEIVTANANFCAALGYRLDEIKGRHHRMFVDPAEAQGADYREFWASLGRGEYRAAEFRRIGKGGREVWIQASYNPILDPNGKPYKVVKYATDITARKAAVNELGDGLGRLAQGDLTARLPGPFVGELDAVRLAFNDTVARFAGIVGRLRATSGSLKTATAEILSGANDLGERTTRQAAAIQETSTAMDQLAATVGDNARRADAASTKAQAVFGAATEGGAVMHEANAAMERITQSSGKISNIIGLDDIAFQTNLLALNASVEAARAGDAGAGFAVVAVEVRRLAQSAARASSEVKALIEQSANEVRGGSKLVSDAADKLAGMLGAVRENTEFIAGIAQATQEQSAAIEQVGTAVRQMDEMTQHNAALVEETNAALEQTESQASELDRIVDVFVVDTEAASARATPPRPKPAPAPRAKPCAAGETYLAAATAVGQDWSEF